MTEQKYATIEKDNKTYVRKLQNIKKDEHVSGVFLNKVAACNVARKIARQSNAEYVYAKDVK